VSELGKRLLTSVIAIPSVTGLLFYAKRYEVDWAVGVLLVAITIVAGAEYLGLLAKMGLPIERWSFLAVAAFLELSWVLLSPRNARLAFFGALLLPFLWYLPQKDGLRRALGAVLGLLYIPYLLHFFYLIYRAPSYAGWVYAMHFLVMVWAYDAGAFFIGSRFGRRPLAPQISPGKTVEGVIGGFLFALIAANLTPIWVNWPHWIPHIVMLAVLVSVAAQLGDLFESKLKRLAGVKDSGIFFPGHGGVLDRIDGILFALPVFYLYFHHILRFV